MTYVFRLVKGSDLKEEIINYAKKHNIEAAIISCCVGCVSKLQLRLADGKTIISRKETFEIVSMTGTVSKNGCHIHISFSDCDGKTVGGHLIEGCIINTTAEICITELENYTFTRKFDKNTGYKELNIQNKITKNELLKLINSLNLPKGHYYILGGGSLVMHGLKETTKDLDLCVSEELFEILKAKYHIDLSSKNNSNFYPINDKIEVVVNPKDKLIYEYKDGYPVENLKTILDFKKKMNREKDQSDIQKIVEYLENK